MLKGKELLDYTINYINPKDKFTAIYILADELVDLGDDISRRAISLLNPITQYSFLESIILEDKDCDTKLIEYLKSMKYPLPIKYGWKQTNIKSDGTQMILDKSEWYSKKHTCYCDMFKAAMRLIENCVDCVTDDVIKITNDGNGKVTLEALNNIDVFEIYELD